MAPLRLLARSAGAVGLSLGSALTVLLGCGEDPVGPGSGPPARLEFEMVSTAIAVSGNFVATPAVRVLDQGGGYLPGVPVQFEVEGGGTLAREVTISGAEGWASPAGWRLGGPGAQRLIARSGALADTISVTATPAPEPRFHINVILVGEEPSATVLEAIREAVNRWEGLILGDLPDFRIPESVSVECPGLLHLRGQTIDDVLMFFVLGVLPQGVVGSTSVCLRRGNGLPAAAAITIDPRFFEISGGLLATLEHEIAHALGFGTIWSGLVGGRGTDRRFMGRSAEAAYFSLLAPSGDGRSGVPIEDVGSAAAVGSHWRESVLDLELLTSVADGGSIGPAGQPLSAITVGALRDLGYVVDDSQADGFGGGAAVRRGDGPRDKSRHSPRQPVL